MPGWGGFAEIMAGLLTKVPAWNKARKLAALRKEADAALERHDRIEHARIMAELERLSDQP